MKNESIKKEIYHALEDADYRDAYLDKEEKKERVLWNGKTISYTYIHGGFRKKGVKFLFCFPEKEAFQGRFYQYLSPFPGPDEELASLDKTGEDDKIAFALIHGAYYVESNMGASHMFGESSEPERVWKASAAVAEYSRKKAMEFYGCERPYGYVYGGSGGGYKTMACIENTDAWDGAVPYVIGSPVSLPNSIVLHVQGQRTLRHAFGKITDALDAGGSGNMYENLTGDEQAMLKEVTAMGFPPRQWFLEAAGVFYAGSLPVTLPGVKRKDPEYFKDFWEKPGYMGSDPKSNASRDRIVFSSVIKAVYLPVEEQTKQELPAKNRVDDAWQKMLKDGKNTWIELEEVPQGDDLYLEGVEIQIQSGMAAGKKLQLGEMHGNFLKIGNCYGMDDPAEVAGMLQPGDLVKLDNSDYVAVQSYYRHQVPKDRSFHAWDQFRGEDGTPIYPQRAEELGYGYNGTGTVQNGNIQGKVIVVQALMDESTFPWCADWYRNKVIEAKGSEKDFRLYYMDRCMHGDVSWLENNVVTNYLGALRQALLDISDWVERGIEPCQTSVYQRDGGQIFPAETAKERKGIQPVAELRANGAECIHVKAGEEVVLCASAQVPEGAGRVTAMDFAFESDPSLSYTPVEVHAFPYAGRIEETQEGNLYGAKAEIRHRYEKPGTYFASVRVKAERKGDKESLYTQVKNIARARIIVED